MTSIALPPSTSASRARRAAPFGWSPRLAPTIVAEALSPVADLLATALRPGPPASGADVARALARSLAPATRAVVAPTWLWPRQQETLGRVLAAIGRYGGALLADPVGSGKTYIALAAAAECGERATCIVPAALVPQWKGLALRLGVAAAVSSHERASRGNLPKPGRGLVVIDESHHFRNPSIRRYREVAEWLGGRPTLLLTGTPVVNRLADVAHQLRLAVRDDALAPLGVPSLMRLLAAGASHAAMAPGAGTARGIAIMPRSDSHAGPTAG